MQTKVGQIGANTLLAVEEYFYAIKLSTIKRSPIVETGIFQLVCYKGASYI